MTEGECGRMPLLLSLLLLSLSHSMSGTCSNDLTVHTSRIALHFKTRPQGGLSDTPCSSEVWQPLCSACPDSNDDHKVVGHTFPLAALRTGGSGRFSSLLE